MSPSVSIPRVLTILLHNCFKSCRVIGSAAIVAGATIGEKVICEVVIRQRHEAVCGGRNETRRVKCGDFGVSVYPSSACTAFCEVACTILGRDSELSSWKAGVAKADTVVWDTVVLFFSKLVDHEVVEGVCPQGIPRARVDFFPTDTPPFVGTDEMRVVVGRAVLDCVRILERRATHFQHCHWVVLMVEASVVQDSPRKPPFLLSRYRADVSGIKCEMSVVCLDELADTVKDNTVISRITSPQVSHSPCGQKVNICVGASGTLQGVEMRDRSIKDGAEMRLNVLSDTFDTCAVNA